MKDLLRCADVYKCMKIAIVDPMCQVLMKPVGEMGFDVAVGSMQRFGVPMGFGGPHAAFFATTDKYKRKIPGTNCRTVSRLVKVIKHYD